MEIYSGVRPKVIRTRQDPEVTLKFKNKNELVIFFALFLQNERWHPKHLSHIDVSTEEDAAQALNEMLPDLNAPLWGEGWEPC